MANLSQNASIIDITDYHNLYIVITTEKNIYTGMPPNKVSSTTSKILNITAAATYDTNYLLLACTEDYLLSKININSGEETPLFNYSYYGFSIENLNYTCSISILNNIVFVGIQQIIDNALKFNVLKIGLGNINDDNGPIWNSSVIKRTLQTTLTNLGIYSFPRVFSCEVISTIKNLEDPRLVIGYLKYDSSKKLYGYYANAGRADFSAFLPTTQIQSSPKLLNFRIQKINSTFLRYLTSTNTIEIYVDGSNVIYAPSELRNPNLFKFPTHVNIFYYHNQYLFYGHPNGINFYLYMKSNISESYVRIIEKNKAFTNCMGYYDNSKDTLEMIYQYTNIIKYFVVKNMNDLFYYECETKTIETLSNETKIVNVSEIMTYPLEHKNFHIAYTVNYPFIGEENWSYDNGKIYFNKSSQILNVTTGFNDWMTFYFCFFGGNLEEDVIFYFTIPACLLHIRPCAFKCGSCSIDYNICDQGTCKTNFSMMRNSSDTDCYPNDQNMPNYIYNKTTKYYEQCYSSCKFCSKQKDLSSNINHNCLTCNEGYLKSYEYMGNCYSIDGLYNKSEAKIIVNNQTDEQYTIVDYCLNKYIIASTGECVSECPTTTNFYEYTYTYQNFSEQTNKALGKMYILKKENIPRFKFGNLCYETCPIYTLNDNTNYLCKCKSGWQQNSTTKEIICYDNKEYCLSRVYFYHLDTNECVLNECREGYYQFNFECYKNNCPENTDAIPYNSNKCETSLSFCYIDEYFKTHCSDEAFDEYNLRANDTKIYFKSCNESLYFFGQKTYLYQNICYDNCPEERINNDIDGTCTCKYYKMYLNEEKTEYKCLTQSEKCEDKNKISINDMNLCIDNLEKCLIENYKIFNNECFNECPENTETKIDNGGVCLCKYDYYNQSNLLTCYGEQEI